jgi:hypothetical protein
MREMLQFLFVSVREEIVHSVLVSEIYRYPCDTFPCKDDF